MDKAERYQGYADNAAKRASEAHASAHEILDRIPMGQPVLLGHHSQKSHQSALGRTDRLMQRAIDEKAKADYWQRRAAHVERSEADKAERIELFPEGVDVGDVVDARFTNSGYVRKFRGEIVGRTKNDWKVRAITSPYADQGEAPGRVYKIAAAGSRTYSPNNCVTKAS